MDNSKIKEVAKFIANRDSLQEQVLLEFPMKMGSLKTGWLDQLSFNNNLFLALNNSDNKQITKFKFDKWQGVSYVVGDSINDLLLSDSSEEIIAFVQYGEIQIGKLNIFDERKVWQYPLQLGLIRKMLFERYLKKYDGIQSDGTHTELGMKCWKKILDDAIRLGYNVNTIKNGDVLPYEPDEFDEYYNRNLFHKFLITKK